MPPPPEVSVATVLSKPVHQWDTFNGRVTAVESVQLRPRVSGYVQRVAFDEGQEVEKGDLLFVIDPRPYQAALDQAQAQLQRARAEAKLAQAQDARAQTLIRSEEHTSELQSLMRNSYAVFCLKKKKRTQQHTTDISIQ